MKSLLVASVLGLMCWCAADPAHSQESAPKPVPAITDTTLKFVIQAGNRLYPEGKEEHTVRIGEKFYLGDTPLMGTVKQFLTDLPGQEAAHHGQVAVILVLQFPRFDEPPPGMGGAEALQIPGSALGPFDQPGPDQDVHIDREVAAHQGQVLLLLAHRLVDEGHGAAADGLAAHPH